MLKISKLKVEVEKKEILKGVDLVVKPGEIAVIMGPNGSGKSTLANILMGASGHKVMKGKISLDEKNLLKMTTDERAKAGLFLGWQSPVAIKGVTVEQLLRAVIMSCKNVVCERTGQVEKCLKLSEFKKIVDKKAEELKIDKKLLFREINVGFSGGEKKKMEVLQMAVLRPKYAILDEVDSGLDIDALKIVAKGINKAKKENSKMGIILITHYQRILEYIKVDRVMVMQGGKIVKSGGKELARILEKEGYEGIK